MSYFNVELPAKFTDFGGMLISGLVEGIRNKLGSVKDSILGMGDSIKSWFSGALDIHSPSRVFIGYGGNLSEGAALGVVGQMGLVRKAVLGMAAATAVTLSPPLLAAPSAPALSNQAQAYASATQASALARGPIAGDSGGGITVHLTQNFTISGGSSSTKEQVLQAGRQGYDEFMRNMEIFEHDRRRRSYRPT